MEELHRGHGTLLGALSFAALHAVSVLGKTNSPVMGFRGTCDNYLFGPSRNPFDPSRNTGGSSGGSAARR